MHFWCHCIAVVHTHAHDASLPHLPPLCQEIPHFVPHNNCVTHNKLKTMRLTKDYHFLLQGTASIIWGTQKYAQLSYGLDLGGGCSSAAVVLLLLLWCKVSWAKIAESKENHLIKKRHIHPLKFFSPIWSKGSLDCQVHTMMRGRNHGHHILSLVRLH